MIIIEKLDINKDTQELLKKYRTYLLTEKHLSDNSIDSYIEDTYLSIV